MISTVDPDARHTRKSPEARRDGYRAHLAADPETGIITDEKLTRAAGPGELRPGGGGAVPGRRGRAPGPAPGDAGHRPPGDGRRAALAWYGDSAYGTGDLRGAIEDAGHAAVIKPKPLQAPVEGGFTVDDFTVDEQAGTVTCPAGHTGRSAGPASPPSARCAGTARCARGAPPARPAASSSCTRAMTCCAPPGRTGPPTPGCARTT